MKPMNLMNPMNTTFFCSNSSSSSSSRSSLSLNVSFSRSLSLSLSLGPSPSLSLSLSLGPNRLRICSLRIALAKSFPTNYLLNNAIHLKSLLAQVIIELLCCITSDILEHVCFQAGDRAHREPARTSRASHQLKRHCSCHQSTAGLYGIAATLENSMASSHKAMPNQPAFHSTRALRSPPRQPCH